MSHVKPSLSVNEVYTVLQRHFGRNVSDVTAGEGGNFSSVFFFELDNEPYVVRFNASKESFQQEQMISKLLSSQEVPYPKICGMGDEGHFSYCISERKLGIVLADLDDEQKIAVVPDLVHVISKMNQVQLGQTTGSGPVVEGRNGQYAAWEQFVAAFYAENQEGTFWENWHELYHMTCLERDVFEEIYARLIAFCQYNAPHRHFVHNDCHEWNIISDGHSITGIIDAGFLYGDFMIDIATIEHAIPGIDLKEAFRVHYEQIGKPIENFKERLTGARYFKGLDGLRFFAKMGWDHAYIELRDKLLSLPKW
ncbi:aminoglycoside phosphotransferase family protein [Bacillus sp. FJAT-28004]|uniref:aminoglycoside phosphotransferase family protein n=1 Tax=Bacillus sp. FJAT-28004 TaxID=1679165 RepID=UPI0006B6905B|nr:aminoglycoside phosphotransferase family protein [Bacillus sp. FJAT-28004]